MGTKNVVPVNRGSTFYGPSRTVPTSYESGSVLLEGTEREFPHTAPGSEPAKPLSDRIVTARLMRNVSGITVYPGMAVTHQAGYEGRRFDGYSRLTADRIAGIVDSHLNANSGCRNGDLCWIVFDGPEYCRYAGGADVSVGDPVYADTAADSTGCTTGGTTDSDAGKFLAWEGVTSSATETTDGTASKKTLNCWGRAMSAATSGNTASSKLVDLSIR